MGKVKNTPKVKNFTKTKIERKTCDTSEESLGEDVPNNNSFDTSHIVSEIQTQTKSPHQKILKAPQKSDSDDNGKNRNKISKRTSLKTSTPHMSSIIAAANLSTKKEMLQKILADSNKTAIEFIQQKDVQTYSQTPKNILKTGKTIVKSDDIDSGESQKHLLPLSQAKYMAMKNQEVKNPSGSDSSFTNAVTSTQVQNSQGTSEDSDSEHNSVLLKRNEMTLKNKIITTPKNVSFRKSNSNRSSSSKKSDSSDESDTEVPNISERKKLIQNVRKENKRLSSDLGSNAVGKSASVQSESEDSDLKNVSVMAQKSDSIKTSQSTDSESTTSLGNDNTGQKISNKVSESSSSDEISLLTKSPAKKMSDVLNVSKTDLVKSVLKKESVPIKRTNNGTLQGKITSLSKKCSGTSSSESSPSDADIKKQSNSNKNQAVSEKIQLNSKTLKEDSNSFDHGNGSKGKLKRISSELSQRSENDEKKRNSTSLVTIKKKITNSLSSSSSSQSVGDLSEEKKDKSTANWRKHFKTPGNKLLNTDNNIKQNIDNKFSSSETESDESNEVSDGTKKRSNRSNKLSGIKKNSAKTSESESESSEKSGNVKKHSEISANNLRSTDKSSTKRVSKSENESFSDEELVAGTAKNNTKKSESDSESSSNEESRKYSEISSNKLSLIHKNNVKKSESNSDSSCDEEKDDRKNVTKTESNLKKHSEKSSGMDQHQTNKISALENESSSSEESDNRKNVSKNTSNLKQHSKIFSNNVKGIDKNAKLNVTNTSSESESDTSSNGSDKNSKQIVSKKNLSQFSGTIKKKTSSESPTDSKYKECSASIKTIKNNKLEKYSESESTSSDNNQHDNQNDVKNVSEYPKKQSSNIIKNGSSETSDHLKRKRNSTESSSVSSKSGTEIDQNKNMDDRKVSHTQLKNQIKHSLSKMNERENDKHITKKSKTNDELNASKRDAQNKSQLSDFNHKSNVKTVVKNSDCDSDGDFEEKKVLPRIKTPQKIAASKLEKSKLAQVSSESDDSNEMTVTQRIQLLSNPEIVDTKDLFKLNSSSKVYNSLKEFIVANPNLEKIEHKTEFLLEDLSDDEEVWIMQCPKDVLPEQLQGQKIQLDKKAKMKFKVDKKKYECISELKTKNICLLATKSNKNNCLNAQIIKSKGNITIHEILNEKHITDVQKSEKELVQSPLNLKVRHPIFGSSFEEKIELDESIQEKLIEAEVHRRKVEAKMLKKKKRKPEINEQDERDQMIFQLLNPIKNSIKLNKSEKETQSRKRKHLIPEAPQNKKMKKEEFLENTKYLEEMKELKKVNSLETDDISRKIYTKKEKRSDENREGKHKKSSFVEPIVDKSSVKKKYNKELNEIMKNVDLQVLMSSTSDNLDISDHKTKHKRKKNKHNDDENELQKLDDETKYKKEKSKLKNKISNIIGKEVGGKSKNNKTSKMIEIENSDEYDVTSITDKYNVTIDGMYDKKKNKHLEINGTLNKSPEKVKRKKDKYSPETSIPDVEVKHKQKKKKHNESNEALENISEKTKHKNKHKSKNIELSSLTEEMQQNVHYDVNETLNKSVAQAKPKKIKYALEIMDGSEKHMDAVDDSENHKKKKKKHSERNETIEEIIKEGEHKKKKKSKSAEMNITNEDIIHKKKKHKSNKQLDILDNSVEQNKRKNKSKHKNAEHGYV